MAVTAADSIGFSCEQEICPISFKSTIDYEVEFYKFTDFPTVGDKESFGAFGFPGKFAFGVYIGTGMYNNVKKNHIVHNLILMIDNIFHYNFRDNWYPYKFCFQSVHWQGYKQGVWFCCNRGYFNATTNTFTCTYN